MDNARETEVLHSPQMNVFMERKKKTIKYDLLGLNVIETKQNCFQIV